VLCRTGRVRSAQWFKRQPHHVVHTLQDGSFWNLRVTKNIEKSAIIFERLDALRVTHPAPNTSPSKGRFSITIGAGFKLGTSSNE
jgi:hypothetical protein